MYLQYRAPRPPATGWRRHAMQELEGGWKLKAKFLALSYLHAETLAPLLGAVPGSSLHRYVQERPDTVGFILWPYQCASWGAVERISRIKQHFEVLDEIGAPFPFSVRDMMLLWDLEEYSPGVRIILEQPKWLFREGMLTLSLFCGNHRAYSLAFSLFKEDGQVAIFIGGLQGRSTEGALERYKTLTKCFHGLRPRDFLIDLLRMLAPSFDARRILAVADDHRYYHHPYFGGKAESDHADYDEIWEDRGGMRMGSCHFELPVTIASRSLEEIPSRKRAQYRRRGEMLAALRESQPPLARASMLRFEAT